jgi:hypothetical protein
VTGGKGQVGNGLLAAEGGSTVRSLYVERTMVLYGLYDHEIESLSFMTALAMMFFSAGSFFLSTGITFRLGGEFSLGKMTPLGEFVYSYGCFAALAVSIFFFVAGVLSLRKRGDTLKAVRENAKQIRTSESR